MASGASESRSAAGGRNPWLIAVIVSIATFMLVLDTSIANVALRNIAGSLAAGTDESTWVITTYSQAFALYGIAVITSLAPDPASASLPCTHFPDDRPAVPVHPHFDSGLRRSRSAEDQPGVGVDQCCPQHRRQHRRRCPTR